MRYIEKSKFKYGYTVIELSDGSRYQINQNTETNKWMLTDLADNDCFDCFNTKREAINYLKLMDGGLVVGSYRCSCCNEIKDKSDSVKMAWDEEDKVKNHNSFTEVYICTSCGVKVSDNHFGVLQYLRSLASDKNKGV